MRWRTAHNRRRNAARIYDYRHRDPVLDSAEGMTILLRFARTLPLVLNEYHAMLAEKYGLSIEGIIISRQLPLDSDFQSPHIESHGESQVASLRASKDTREHQKDWHWSDSLPPMSHRYRRQETKPKGNDQ
jgi:hypothetical protein